MRALRSDGGRDGAVPVRADRLRWGFRDETVQQTASVRGIKTIVHLLARGRLTFLGHCIHGVICEIRTRFIRRTCGARALPSADVNTAQICARAYERERERERRMPNDVGSEKSRRRQSRCGGETPNTIRLTRGHLDDLDRIQCTEGVGISADGMEG